VVSLVVNLGKDEATVTEMSVVRIASWHLLDGSPVTPEQQLGIGADRARLTDSGPRRGPSGEL